MGHSIPENAKNSELMYLIDEYVRLERDQRLLKDHWFRGLSFKELENKYNLSLTSIKKIIYGIGDKLLLKLI